MFVILATVIGAAVGQMILSDVDMGNGETQPRRRLCEAADFPEP